MTTEGTRGSLSCSDGEAEVRGIQLQHETLPLGVPNSTHCAFKG